MKVEADSDEDEDEDDEYNSALILSMTTPQVHLLPKRARPFYGRHPWVYTGAIATVIGNPADGDEVDVHSHGGAFIARGLYNSQSRIRVRLYSWEADRPLDRDFFRERLEQAIHLRRNVLKWSPFSRSPQASVEVPEIRSRESAIITNACRLVFSEGDGLSGMIVDQYDRWLVVQFTGLGLANRREMIVELLRELVEPEGIYLRTERGIGKLEGLDLQDGPLWGNLPTAPVVIREEGPIEFLVNFAEGQKTGFYLDQRDNRRAVAELSAGRRVLDCFCYTGGFSLHAARAGARDVVGVDVSESALAMARENALRNGFVVRNSFSRSPQASVELTGIRSQESGVSTKDSALSTEHLGLEFVQADVFDYLESAVRSRQKFDLIVLDPPKFARAQHAVEDALKGYRRLQTLALLLLENNGILVTCCCSGLIEMHMIESLMSQVAAEAKRPVQILERRGQSADHPVAVSCLESGYLKCLITRVL